MAITAQGAPVLSPDTLDRQILPGPQFITDPAIILPVAMEPPQITGDAIEDETLTASSGAWINLPTSLAYSWQRDGADIPGATASTYTVTAGDIGHMLTVTVTATNAAGTGNPAVSEPAGPVDAAE